MAGKRHRLAWFSRYPTERMLVLRETMQAAELNSFHSFISVEPCLASWADVRIWRRRLGAGWIWMRLDERALEEIFGELKIWECFSYVHKFSSLIRSVCFQFRAYLQPWWYHTLVISVAAPSATLAAEVSCAFQVGIEEWNINPHWSFVQLQSAHNWLCRLCPTDWIWKQGYPLILSKFTS